METLAIKFKLQKMIEDMDDISVLQAIYTLLEKTTLDPVLKSKLTSRAEKSEADIVAERIFTKEAVIERTNKIGK